MDEPTRDAAPTSRMYSLREVTEALLKHSGVKKGQWNIAVTFGFGVGAFQSGPNGAIRPGGVVSVMEVGLQETTEENVNELTVDASTLARPKKNASPKTGG